MRREKLSDMTKGWFIGNFEPSLWKTNNVEVGVKTYALGDYESAHVHKVATEFTVVVKGSVRMNGVTYYAGDIIVIQPGEKTDFESLEDETITTVVKIPGANNDKYMV